jgi:hypothetical protein
VRRTLLPAPPVSGWIGYPLGFVAAVAVTIVAVAAHATDHPLWSVAALAVTTAAVCWMLHAGFVLGRHGDLQFSSASTGAAALLVAVAMIAHAAGLAVRVGLRASQRTVAVPRPGGPVTRRLSGSTNGSASA